MTCLLNLTFLFPKYATPSQSVVDLFFVSYFVIMVFSLVATHHIFCDVKINLSSVHFFGFLHSCLYYTVSATLCAPAGHRKKRSERVWCKSEINKTAKQVVQQCEHCLLLQSSSMFAFYSNHVKCFLYGMLLLARSYLSTRGKHPKKTPTDGGVQKSINENIENIWLMRLQIICTVEFVQTFQPQGSCQGLAVNGGRIS